MKEFKAGDKVYHPLQSNKVLTVYEHDDSEYPITIDSGNTFTIDGKLYIYNALPSIYHATPENHKALEQLYGVEFEKPPVNPTSKEIVKAYLDRGDKNVCCWASNTNEQPRSISKWVFIDQVIDGDCPDGDCPFVDQDGRHWKHATPFDRNTLQPITKLPT